MAREKWVPTGRELDEGFDPGIARPRRGPLKKLLEAVTPRRVAKHHVWVKEGVGESRVMGSAPSIEVTRSTSATQVEGIVPATRQAPTAVRKHAGALQNISTQPTPAAESPAPRRSRRKVRIAEDVMPAFGAADDDPDGRSGTWPPNLSGPEMHRRIGPTQRYGDDT